MGESPREAAARELSSELVSLRQRLLGGDLSGQSLYGYVDPYFSQAKRELKGSKDYLNAALMARMAGIGQTLGEGIASAGIPRGAPAMSLYTLAMSPAIAETQQQLSGIEQAIAGVSQRQGLTLADLLRFSIGQGLGTTQTQLGATELMKRSTGVGDVLSVLTTLGTLASAKYGSKTLAELIAGLLFGGGDASMGVPVPVSTGVSGPNYA